MYPIIGLAGKAGSGKDTAGKYLAENYNGICIGQADPLKRFAKKIFRFNDEQLWGSSEHRNAVLKNITHRELEEFQGHIYMASTNWVDSIFSPINKQELHGMAVEGLEHWFKGYILNNYTELSLRHLLMSLGTDFMREQIYRDVWVDYAIYVSRCLLGGGYSYTREFGLTRDVNAKNCDCVIITDIRFRDEFLAINSVGGKNIKVRRSVPENELGALSTHSSETELDTVPRHFYSLAIDNNDTLSELHYELDQFMSENNIDKEPGF